MTERKEDAERNRVHEAVHEARRARLRARCDARELSPEAMHRIACIAWAALDLSYEMHPRLESGAIAGADDRGWDTEDFKTALATLRRALDVEAP